MLRSIGRSAFGLTSTMKGWVSHNPAQTEFLQNAGWIDLLETKTFVNENGKFDVNIPLKMFLGFAEAYQKIIINCRNELVLIRANSDDGAILQTRTAEAVKVKLENIEWHMPLVQLSTEYEIRMLKQLERQKVIKMAFRSWDLYEYSTLPSTISRLVCENIQPVGKTLIRHYRFLDKSQGRDGSIKSMRCI